MTKIIGAAFGSVRTTAHPEGVAFAPVFWIAKRRLQVVALVDGVRHRLAGLQIVERREEMVEAQHCVGFDRPDLAHDDVGVVHDSRQQVERRAVEEVHLAGADRAVGGGGIRHHDELDPVKLDQLAAGEAAGWLLARHVAIKPVIDQARAGTIFGGVEAERAGADALLHRGKRIGQRFLLAHDGAGNAIAAAEQEFDVVER